MIKGGVTGKQSINSFCYLSFESQCRIQLKVVGVSDLLGPFVVWKASFAIRLQPIFLQL